MTAKTRSLSKIPVLFVYINHRLVIIPFVFVILVALLSFINILSLLERTPIWRRCHRQRVSLLASTGQTLSPNKYSL